MKGMIVETSVPSCLGASALVLQPVHTDHAG